MCVLIMYLVSTGLKLDKDLGEVVSVNGLTIYDCDKGGKFTQQLNL